MQGQSGACLWSARAITDLPVPRPPAMTTPPMSGFTAARRSAVLMGVCPTTSESGKACFAIELSLKLAPDSASMAAAARSTAANSPSSQFSASAHVEEASHKCCMECLEQASLPSLFSTVPVIDHPAVLCEQGHGSQFLPDSALDPTHLIQQQGGSGAEHKKVDGTKAAWIGDTGERSCARKGAEIARPPFITPRVLAGEKAAPDPGTARNPAVGAAVASTKTATHIH